jgi:hypothetical protein
MKRRKFGLLASSSILALANARSLGFAQTMSPAELLKTTLTPMGAERAGNAAGTIPAWTGGLNETPAGFNWNPNQTLPPDFFVSDAMLYEINPSNLAQYSDILTEGLQALITNRGFSIKVYPTRRTAAAPQWVYDNTLTNTAQAQLNPNGGRLGFTNAYGGIPFPIPDTSNPLNAGSQIIWNHQARWNGPYESQTVCTYTVPNGQVTLVNAERANFKFWYYQQDGNLSNYNGYFYSIGGPGQFAPSTVAGGQVLSMNSSDPLVHPNITWQLLAGQGRVRKAPEVLYDTPSSYADGIINYDEYFGFNGPLDKYDWRLIEKKEMLIPYNNNQVFQTAGPAAHKDKYFDPAVVRWELHRVWVVEATLHPGKRNVLGRRKIYVDEDTWIIGVVDAWDDGGNLCRTSYNINANFPNLPGTIFQNTICYNPQSGDYVSLSGSYSDAPFNAAWNFGPVPDSIFEPQSMAAAASY